MEFKKEILEEVAYMGPNDEEYEGITVVKNELVDTSRWSKIFDLVFKFENKFYRVDYRVGATEQQDERPFEYGDDLIECKEVKPVEKTIIVYE